MVTITADQIRAYVNKAIVEPARRTGKSDVTIVARDVHKDLKLVERMPAVCSAIDAQKFQEQYRLILSSRSGPKQGPRATWCFSIQR